MRLDVWLDVACLFRTRSEAKRACEAGRVEVNGQPARPHRVVREGDRVRISRPYGRHQDVRVQAIHDRHIKRSDARALYDDLTPQPSAEQIEMLRIDRAYRAVARAAGTPDRRQRRALRGLKEGR